MKNSKFLAIAAMIAVFSTTTAFAEEPGKERGTNPPAGQWNDITSTKQFTIYDNCTVTVRATDAAGNITEKTITITNIDGVLPQLSAQVQDNGKDIKITATDTPSGIQKVVVGDKEYTSGSFTHTIPAGYNWSTPLKITAYDLAGNASTPITYDRAIPPKYPLIIPPDAGGYVPAFPYNINYNTGITNPDDVVKIEISINDAGFQDYTSNFKQNAPYVNNLTITKECDIVVKVTDAWNRVTEITFDSSKEDNIAPVLTTTVHDDGENIDINATDVGSGILKVTVGNQEFTEENFTYTIPADYDWSQPIEIKAYDKANNVSNVVTYDREIPPKHDLTKPDNDAEFVSKYPYTFDLDVGITNPDDVSKVEVSANGEGFSDYTANFKQNVPVIKDFVIKNECDIVIKVTDAWGRESQVEFPAGTLDDEAPVLTAIPTEDGKKIDISTTDVGSGTEKITINNQEFAPDDFTWTIPTDYDWSNSIVIKAFDHAGNESNTVTFDKEIPQEQNPTVSTPDGVFVPSYPNNIDILVDALTPENVQKVEIQADADGWVDYTDNYKTNNPYVKDYTVTKECTITAKVTDIWGRESETEIEVGTLDDVAPVLFVVPTDDGKELNISATDEGSGINKILINSQEFTEENFTYTIPADYDWSVPINVVAYDNANNQSEEFVFDQIIPPVAEPEVSTPDGTFVNKYPTTIDIFIDKVKPEEVEKVEIAVDDGDYNDYTPNYEVNAPYVKDFEVTEECVLHVKVTDIWGREIEFEINVGTMDSTKPTGSFTVNQDKTEITITGSDGDGNTDSGVDKIIINGTEYTDNPVRFPITGQDDIVVQIVDKAGNISDDIVIDYDTVLDPEVPTILVSLPTGWVKVGTDTVIPVTTMDNSGHVSKLESKIGDGEWVDITATNQFTVNQNCTVELKATDAAGNVGTLTVDVTFFDGSIPEVSVDVSPDGDYVIIQGEDDKSGIGSITINGKKYPGRVLLYLMPEPEDLEITVENNLGVSSTEKVMDYDKDINPPETEYDDDDDKGNSSGSSTSKGGKYGKSKDSWNDSTDYWEEVNKKIRKSEQDSAISVDVKGFYQVPRSTMETLNSRPDVTLNVKYNQGRFTIKPGDAVKVEVGRIFYKLQSLDEYYTNLYEEIK